MLRAGTAAEGLPDGTIRLVGSAGAPEFGDGTEDPFYEQIQTGTEVTAGGSAPSLQVERSERSRQQEASSEAVAPAGARLEVTVKPAGLGAGAAAGGGAHGAILGAAAASAALAQAAGQLGRAVYGPYADVQLYGLWGEGGASFAGGRARLRAVAHGDFLQASVGFEYENDMGGRMWLDETYLVKRGEEWKVKLGRQRILEGPVNNTDYGRLLTFGLADGAYAQLYWQPWRATFSAAWLGDYDDWLHGDGEGLYARASFNLFGGHVAVSALKRCGAGTGVAADFAAPVWPGEVDVYGQAGDDPFGQHFETFGLHFPGVYQRYGLDIFVERAQRHGADTVTSAFVYWDVCDNVRLVGIAADTRRSGSFFGLGCIASVSFK